MRKTILILLISFLYACNSGNSNRFEPVTPLGKWVSGNQYLEIDTNSFLYGSKKTFVKGDVLYNDTKFVMIDSSYNGEVWKYEKIGEDTLILIEPRLNIEQMFLRE